MIEEVIELAAPKADPQTLGKSDSGRKSFGAVKDASLPSSLERKLRCLT